MGDGGRRAAEEWNCEATDKDKDKDKGPNETRAGEEELSSWAPCLPARGMTVGQRCRAEKERGTYCNTMDEGRGRLKRHRRGEWTRCRDVLVGLGGSKK